MKLRRRGGLRRGVRFFFQLVLVPLKQYLVAMRHALIYSALVWLMIGNIWAQSGSYFPRGQKLVGLEDFFLNLDPVWTRGQPLNLGYRLGIRGGYYVADGFSISVGLSRSVQPQGPFSQIDPLRWNIAHLHLRYYLTHQKRWTPLVGGSLYFAGTDEDVVAFGQGAGASLGLRAGVALRINATWSIDLTAHAYLPLGEATLEPYGGSADRTVGIGPKWGLHLHW